jgi:hypothetical protein
MLDRDPIFLTWSQRRELELERWLDGHLHALGGMRTNLDSDPATLRAIAVRAAEAAAAAEALLRLRGEDEELEAQVAAFRAQLDELG